jgi:Bifunctional DNA primase/polymerase, N-terminal
VTVLGGSTDAAAYLQLHDCFQGYVLPMKGKEPDVQMSKRQRGTAAWKKGRDSFCNRPATREEVEEWAAEGCGIGAILGERSGVVALEIDCPELFLPLLADLPTFKTPTATSPGGGYHLLFRHGAGVKNRRFCCPVFNDKDSPCYTGKGELASMRASDLLIALPPAPGREWWSGRSIRDVEPMDLPPGLVDLLERFTEGGEKRLPIEQGMDQHPPIEHNPCSIGNSVLLEDQTRYVLLVDPSVLSLATDKDSPLIPALVNRLGGSGCRVPCPYHPPDQKASANFWYHKSGWYFADHHFTPSHNVPVSQLCADLLTGYLERCRNGSENRYQHRVYRLNKDGGFKVDLQAFVWLVLAAADLGLVTLPPATLPQELAGFTTDGERIMRFIDQWDRTRLYTCNTDVFPLARTFLISVLYALPSPGKDEPKAPEWTAAYNEIDNTLYRARRQGILEKVRPGVKGYGGKPTLYRVCTNGGEQ